MQNDIQNNDDEYARVRGYLLFLRSTNSEQKALSENFFTIHQNDRNTLAMIKRIVDNVDENDDVRLQAMIIMKRVFNVVNTKYIEYKKQDSDDTFPIINNTNHLLTLPSDDTLPTLQINQALNCERLLNCLPYIDKAFTEDPKLIEEKNMLIQQEAKEVSKDKINQYINSKYPEIISSYSFLDMPKHLDTVEDYQTKFEIPPVSKYYNDSEWDKRTKEMSLTSEHLDIQNFNLDLLITYGPSLWNKYSGHVKNIITQLENEKLRIEKMTEDLHKQRKFDQVGASETLRELEVKYYQETQFHMELEKKCFMMKKRIQRLLKHKGHKLSSIKK